MDELRNSLVAWLLCSLTMMIAGTITTWMPAPILVRIGCVMMVMTLYAWAAVLAVIGGHQLWHGLKR